METTIRQTQTTIQETVTTLQATYNITTNTVNGELRHISAVVIIPSNDDVNGEFIQAERRLGTLAWIDGRVKMTAETADNILPSLVKEFIEIIESIKEREA